MPPDINRILRDIEIAGFRDHPASQRLLYAYQVTGNPRYLQTLDRLIGRGVRMNTDAAPFAPSPAPEDVKHGQLFICDLLLGDGSLGGPARLAIDYTARGILVAGEPGTGKTTFLVSLVVQCLQLPEAPRVLILDREDELLPYLAPAVEQGLLRVANFRDLRINLFELMPGETPDEGISRIVSPLRGLSYFRDFAESLCVSILKRLYQDHGIYDGSQDFPTLSDFMSALGALRFRLNSRELQAWQTVNRAFGELSNLAGEVYNCIRGHPLEAILSNDVLITGLVGLGDSLYYHFANDLLCRILALRERQGLRPPTNLLVIDEIHRILGGTDRWDISELPAIRIARLGRRRGLNLLAATQTPSEVPQALMATVGTRLVMRLHEGKDLRVVSESMSLSHEQRMFIPTMATRQIIVHHPGVALPFLGIVPDMRLPAAADCHV